MRPTRIACLVLSASLVLAACGDDDEGAATDDASSTTVEVTTTEAEPTTTTTAGPPATEEPTDIGDSDDTGRSELEDGRHFGYWASFEIGDTIAFGELDLAYFLTGPDAEAAAAERGDEVNNDYYVVNDNPKLRTLIAHGDTEVVVLADPGGPDLVSSNVADFAVDRHEGSGFWVTIEDGIVTKIEEQYVP